MNTTTDKNAEVTRQQVPSEQLLDLPMREAREAAIHGIANAICLHTPPGYVVSLCCEDGAAWVELRKDGVGNLELPDSSDKSLLEQLNDALCVANGWRI